MTQLLFECAERLTNSVSVFPLSLDPAEWLLTGICAWLLLCVSD